MKRRSAVVLSCLLVGALGLSSRAADNRPPASQNGWPQWRGALRDGVSHDAGLLNEWPADGPPLVWKATGLGRGFSSLSIADGHIFTMGDRAGGEFVIALDLASGKELWSARIGDIWEPQGYAGPRATPTIDGKRIYALGPHGDLVCLEAESGKEVWHRKMQSDFGGRMHSGWGYSESPLIDGDRLVCTPGGVEAAMVALDKLTGKEIWRTAIPSLGEGDFGSDGAAYSSIVISNGGGLRQYVQLMGRGVIGVGCRDGKFLWGFNRVVNKTANIPTPLVHGDYVFCSTGYGAGAVLLKLQAEKGGVKAEPVYFLEGKEFQNHHGGMIMLGDYLYCGHGHSAELFNVPGMENRQNRLATQSRAGHGLGRRGLCRRQHVLPLRERHHGLDRRHAGGVSGEGAVQDSQCRTAQLVAPGDRRRPHVFTRAGCVVLL